MSKKKISIDNAFQLSLFEMELFETTVIPEEEYTDSKTILSLENTEPLSKEFVFKYACKENVWEQYDWLREHQAIDAAKIEKRFFIDNKKGIQVTNGTGVGKTFMSLAVANRFYYQDKKNILIVVPTDKKCRDWVKDNNRKFDTEAKQLKDISFIEIDENGIAGIVVTTYANFYQNEQLELVDWDLIIYDESHKLMENGKRQDTVYLQKHRRIGKFPNFFKETIVRDNMDYFKSLSVKDRDRLLEDYTSKTKIIFLSASPFAYHGSLIIGDGSLWDIKQNYSMETDSDLMNIVIENYNQRGPEEKFLMENFGYRMRFGKLTIPESGVDISLMERMFFDNQVKIGAITGRQIKVDKDYSREFKILNSEIGNKIDEGISVLESNEFKKNYHYLSQVTDNWITWIYKNQLLESIKAKLAVPRIKKHLKLGRKVVIFHDYKNAEPYHPFKFNATDLLFNSPGIKINYNTLDSEIKKFKNEYPELYNMDVANDLVKIQDYYSDIFGNSIGFFNGDISKSNRSKIKDAFQDDLSGLNIICVQRQAGKEGIDLHDTTGVYQRVIIDLGLPRRPTDSIQCEGRTYRDGLMSNTIWEYLIINTIFERSTFAQQISERASTAENLAMGSLARNLKHAFKQGYEEADEDEPNLEQGVGGKQKDYEANLMSDFDRSVALYYSNQKKTAKNKAKEGTDYFATPEPIGFKMVEWADIRPNQRVLEPSAGHGAIARFFPGHSTNYAIEPSRELISRLRLNCDTIDQDCITEGTFENVSKVNKFSSIIMNPPFGNSASTAIKHLEKALINHTYHYLPNNDIHTSRVIAIMPNSPFVDKFVNKMINESDYYENKESVYSKHDRISLQKKLKLSAKVILPQCTFKRAGTSVMCNIWVFDIINSYNENAMYKEIDLSDCKKVEDLFKEIENLHIQTFIPYVE